MAKSAKRLLARAARIFTPGIAFLAWCYSTVVTGFVGNALFDAARTDEGYDLGQLASDWATFWSALALLPALLYFVSRFAFEKSVMRYSKESFVRAHVNRLWLEVAEMDMKSKARDGREVDYKPLKDLLEEIDD